MQSEGPFLEDLLRRVAETPPDFLLQPFIGSSGCVHVAAVVADLLEDLTGERVTPNKVAALGSKKERADRGRISVALIMSWLFYAESLRPHLKQAELLELILDGSAELSPHVAASKCVSDPDRREEFVRFCLSKLGLRPKGESRAQAEDRLTAISSAARKAAIAASRGALERSRAVLAALKRKAAQESADKYTRE